LSHDASRLSRSAVATVIGDTQAPWGWQLKVTLTVLRPANDWTERVRAAGMADGWCVEALLMATHGPDPWSPATRADFELPIAVLARSLVTGRLIHSRFRDGTQYLPTGIVLRRGPFAHQTLPYPHATLDDFLEDRDP